MVVVMIMVSACSGGLDSQWVRTTDGALFWASSVDTTMSYSWKGEAFDSIANGNFLIACGAAAYNSANYIPNMELWKKFDPEGAYEEIYNRYAHVVFSMTTEATTMELIQGDFFRVNLSYSDLEKLDVDYICSISPLDESYGLTMEYAQGGIYVYKNIGN